MGQRRAAMWLGVLLGTLTAWAAGGTANAAAASPGSAPATGVSSSSGTAAAPAAQPAIDVKGFVITGNDSVPAETLLPLLQEAVGKRLTLAQIEALAGRITEYYRAQGFLVAQAYVPAQDVTGGVVRIDVVEGRYGEIQLQDEGRLRPEAAARYLKAIRPGEPIRDAPLARALLLLTDIPGVRAGTALSAGAAPGSSDLRLTIQEGPIFHGRLSLDNHGNANAGAVRGGVHLELDDPAGVGDTFALDGIAGGRELQSGRFAYVVPVGGQGLSAGFAYSTASYHLGGAFAALDASGIQQSAQLHLDAALRRSAPANLTASLRYEHESSVAEIGGGFQQTTQKRIDRTTLGLNGDRRVRGERAVAYALDLTSGYLQIDSPQARALDAQSAQTAGAYGVLSGSADLAQALSSRSTLKLHLQGQIASKNLDAAERMALGGPDGVRGYDVGEATGDQGWLARAEWSRAFALPGWQGRTAWALFWDGGAVEVNRNPWPGAGQSGWITLNDVGAGLDWQLDRFAFKLRAAHPLGPDEIGSQPAPPWRVWLKASWAW